MWLISTKKTVLNKTVNNQVTALDKGEEKSNYMLLVSQIHKHLPRDLDLVKDNLRDETEVVH